jgi:PAS domain S-box-containing protein
MDEPHADGPVRIADFDLSVLFEASQDALLVADASRGRVRLWNAPALAMFGYTAEAAADLSLGQLFRRGDGGRLEISLVGYPATRDRAHVGVPVEVTAVRKDGEPLPVRLVMWPLGPEGRVGSHFVLVRVQAVADQLRAEAEGARRERLAGAQIEARTAHHHLSNHLALVAGSLELLLEDTPLDEMRQELALQALAGIEKANTTLQQLMQLSDYIESADWAPDGPMLEFNDPKR